VDAHLSAPVAKDDFQRRLVDFAGLTHCVGVAASWAHSRKDFVVRLTVHIRYRKRDSANKEIELSFEPTLTRKKLFCRIEQLIIMTRIDVTDEAVIDAPPRAVYRAILNEYAGATQLFMPYIKFEPRENTPIKNEGAVIDVTVYPAGGMNARFAARLTKLVEARLIEEEVSGDFVGTGTWTLEPTEGKTRLRFRFNVKTNKASMSLLSPFVNYEKRHSDVMQKGLKACNNYFCK